MTKKERTIKACRELAAKYRKPEGRLFFCWLGCPLCHIHKPHPCTICDGCPLAETYSPPALHRPGCYQFRTAQNARKLVGDIYKGKGHKKQNHMTNDAFDARAAFFDKIIPILEGIPAERFTKRGWKYFDMLDRSW